MIIEKLEYIADKLNVSYRGSDQPQTVRIRMDCTDHLRNSDAPGDIDDFVRRINWGGSGGAEFSPLIGAAKLLSGETIPSELSDDHFAEWNVELAGVTPTALRPLIERLGFSIVPEELVKLSIVGSLSPDGSELSVTTDDVLRWLEDTDDFPIMYEPYPFELEGREINKGARIKVKPKGVTSKKLHRDFEDLILAWSIYINFLPNRKLSAYGQKDGPANLSRTKTELIAGFGHFDFDIDPPRDLLVNMLHRFHHTVCPLERVELAFP